MGIFNYQPTSTGEFTGFLIHQNSSAPVVWVRMPSFLYRLAAIAATDFSHIFQALEIQEKSSEMKESSIEM